VCGSRVKAKHYVGSSATAEWAKEVLGLPLNGDIFFEDARNGDVEAVKWIRTHADPKKQ
jgi:predicted NBD/HSP70 family sugar kinase